MKKIILYFLFFNLTFAQVTWKKHIVQYNGSIELPTDFKKGLLVASGTLQWFNSIKYPDIEITIESFGTGNEQELEKTYQEDIKRFKGIVYKVKKSNWFVISGKGDDGYIFYNKSIIKNGIQFHLRITYLEKNKKYMDAVLSRISNSFK